VKVFAEHHEMFRATVRAFVEREVMPHVEAWEAAGRIPKTIWPRMGELGFLGVEYDEKYGGAGADLFTTAVLHTGTCASTPSSASRVTSGSLRSAAAPARS
jgi:alkylation response protein AidB-like acyl-CoA dehydrogenase